MKGATCRQMQWQINATNLWTKFCFQEYWGKHAWEKRDGREVFKVIYTYPYMVNQQHVKRPCSPATLQRHLQTLIWSCGRGFSAISISLWEALSVASHPPNCWNLTLFSLNFYLAKKITNNQNRMGFRKLKAAEALRIPESSLLFLCHCNTWAFQADWASSAQSIWSQGPALKAAPKHNKELLTFCPIFCQGQLNKFVLTSVLPPLLKAFSSFITSLCPFCSAKEPFLLPCLLYLLPLSDLSLLLLSQDGLPVLFWAATGPAAHCAPPAAWQTAYVSPEPSRMAVIHCHN